jgi:aminoglycoside phosphotransferase (APT) family kinase protein
VEAAPGGPDLPRARRFPQLERASRLRTWVAAHGYPAPPVLDLEDSVPVICHGDFHLGNVLFNHGKLAVIDWTGTATGLAAGDLRLLYLAWLLALQPGEVADEETEPPVPPGLGT